MSAIAYRHRSGLHSYGVTACSHPSIRPSLPPNPSIQADSRVVRSRRLAAPPRRLHRLITVGSSGTSPIRSCRWLQVSHCPTLGSARCRRYRHQAPGPSILPTFLVPLPLLHRQRGIRQSNRKLNFLVDRGRGCRELDATLYCR